MSLRRSSFAKVLAPLAVSALLVTGTAAPASAAPEITITNGNVNLDGLWALLPKLGVKAPSPADKAKIAELEASKTTLNGELFSLQGTLTMYEQSLSQLKAQLGDRTPEGIQQEIATLTEEIASLETLIDEQESKYNGLEDHIESLRGQLAATEQTHAVLKAQAEAFPDTPYLSDAVVELEGVIANIRMAIDNRQAQEEQVEATIAAARASIAEKKAALQEYGPLKSLINQIIMHQNAVDDYTTRVAAKQAEIAAIDAKIATLNEGSVVTGYTLTFNGALVECDGKPFGCWTGDYEETPLFDADEPADDDADEPADDDADEPADDDADEPADDDADEPADDDADEPADDDADEPADDDADEPADDDADEPADDDADEPADDDADEPADDDADEPADDDADEPTTDEGDVDQPGNGNGNGNGNGQGNGNGNGNGQGNGNGNGNGQGNGNGNNGNGKGNGGPADAEQTASAQAVTFNFTLPVSTSSSSS